MKLRVLSAAAGLLFLGGVALSSLSTAAASVPTDTPTPGAGSSTIGFTVTATPTPTPTGGGQGSGGTGGGGTGGGGSTGAGTTPPVCVPDKTEVKLTPAPVANPKPLKLSATAVAQDGSLLLAGDGFKPGETVVIGLYSSPVKLGTSTVRTNGQVYAEITIPRKTPFGAHTIQVQGYRDCRIAAAPVLVVSRPGLGFSIYPWITWLLVGSVVGISALAFLIYLALGWVAKSASVGLVAGSSA